MFSSLLGEQAERAVTGAACQSLLVLSRGDPSRTREHDVPQNTVELRPGLTDRAADVVCGQWRSLMVTGCHGSSKSHVLQSLASRADDAGHPVVRVGPHAQAPETALSPYARVLVDTADELTDDKSRS